MRQDLEEMAAEGRDLSRFGAWAMNAPVMKDIMRTIGEDHSDPEAWLQGYVDYVLRTMSDDIKIMYVTAGNTLPAPLKKVESEPVVCGLNSILLVQIDPFGGWHLLSKTLVHSKLLDDILRVCTDIHDFKMMDVTGSRASFDDDGIADIEQLQELVSIVAETHGLTATVRRILDPGQGLVLPEDMKDGEPVYPHEFIMDKEEQAATTDAVNKLNYGVVD